MIMMLKQVFCSLAVCVAIISTISCSETDQIVEGNNTLFLNDTFCAVDSILPKSVSKCLCDATGPVSCDHNKKKLRLLYDTKDQLLFINGSTTNSSLQNLINFFKFLPMANITSLHIKNWCNDNLSREKCSKKLTTTRHLNNVSMFSISSGLAPSPKLQTLNISLNCFRKFDDSLGKNFPNLKKLSLSSNFHFELPQGTMKGLFELQQLDLSNNAIATLNRNHFKNMKSLIILNMENNCLSHLTDDLFVDLTEVQHMNLSSNGIESVSNKTFSENQQLIKLDFSKNKIRMLPEDAFNALNNLQVLDLSYNRLTTLPSKILRRLRSLKDLYLMHNQLNILPDNLFILSWKIQLIYLNSNNFTRVPLVKLYKNPIGFRFDFIFIGKQVPIPQITRTMYAKLIDISDNCYSSSDPYSMALIPNPTTIMTDHIRCQNCCLEEFPFPMLHGVKYYAEFQNNFIPYFDMRILNYTHDIHDVDLQHNDIRTMYIELTWPLLQGELDFTTQRKNPKTKYNLNHNPINCDCALMNFLVFIRDDTNSYLPPNSTKSDIKFVIDELYCNEPEHLRGTLVQKLSVSDLKCNIEQYDGCPEKCECVYTPYNEQVEINCINKELTEVPQINTDYLVIEDYINITNFSVVMHLEHNDISSLPSPTDSLWLVLKELYLSYNQISSLQNLTYIPALEKLHLDNNNIQSIETSLIELVEATNKSRLVDLTLSGNQWPCNCQMQELKTLMFQTGLVSDSRYMKCSQNDVMFSINAVTDYDICPNEHQLLFRKLAIIIPILAAVLVLIIIIAVIVYFYRAELKFWLFYHGWCLCWVTEEDIDADKVYDAFISHSSLDEDWVCNQLVTPLETEFPRYKLCMHSRDWLGGEWIPDQIAKSVQQSRRTIIVLTENFVKSDWSRLEFRVAFQQMMDDHVKRILMVVPGKLPDVSLMDKDLQVFVATNTYLLGDDPNFLRKLRCAMPRVQREYKAYLKPEQEQTVNDDDLKNNQDVTVNEMN